MWWVPLIQMGMQNRAASEQAAQQRIALGFQGREAERQAKQQATLIRREGEESKGAAKVYLATSGMGLNSETAKLIMDEYSRRIESDIAQTLLEGKFARMSGGRLAGQITKATRNENIARGLGTLMQMGAQKYAQRG